VRLSLLSSVHRHRHASAALLALVTLACTTREVAELAIDQSREQRKRIPVRINRQADVLFVIDNSQSMVQEQQSLAANFPRFMEVLERIEGGTPDLHIGVVSTDMGAPVPDCTPTGDAGALQNAPRVPGCAPPADPYIEVRGGADGGSTGNYEGELADSFACIAQLGATGCGFEQPLAAMKAALSQPASSGFLRDDAHLAVIFITDEDDCSVRDDGLFATARSDRLGPLTSHRCFTAGVRCNPDRPQEPGTLSGCEPRDDSPYLHPVTAYSEFLRSLKPHDPGLIITAGIVGAPGPVQIIPEQSATGVTLAPSCSSASGHAKPPIRLGSLLDSFAGRSTTSSICDTDLSAGLTQISSLLAEAIGTPCIEGRLVDSDGNPGNGLQAECKVSELRAPGTPRERETVVPPCSNSRAPASSRQLPCWVLVEDEDTCSDTESHLALELIRDRGPGDVSQVTARCLVR
jgi:hypothetical protein